MMHTLSPWFKPNSIKPRALPLASATLFATWFGAGCIDADPLFSNAPSQLAYCFSPKKPNEGRANLYLPTKVDENTPTILFLHGFGGSFLFYQHFLVSTFPEFMIICPAGKKENIIPYMELLRREIESHDFPFAGRQTASFGAAAFKGKDTIKSLIARADNALYSAKKNGRNRAEFL